MNNVTISYPNLALQFLALVSPVVVPHGVTLPVEERAQGAQLLLGHGRGVAEDRPRHDLVTPGRRQGALVPAGIKILDIRYI